MGPFSRRETARVAQRQRSRKRRRDSTERSAPNLRPHEGDLERDEAVLFPPDTRPERLFDSRIPTMQRLPAATSAERDDTALVFDPTCGCLREIAIQERLRMTVPELRWTSGFSGDLAYAVPLDKTQSGARGQKPGSSSQNLGQIIYIDRQGRHHDFGLRGLPVAFGPRTTAGVLRWRIVENRQHEQRRCERLFLVPETDPLHCKRVVGSFRKR